MWEKLEWHPKALQKINEIYRIYFVNIRYEAIAEYNA